MNLPSNLINPGAQLEFPASSAHSGAAPLAYTDLDLSSIVGSRKAIVILSFEQSSGGNVNYRTKPNGKAKDPPSSNLTSMTCATNNIGWVAVWTDATGKIEWMADNVAAVTIIVEAYLVP